MFRRLLSILVILGFVTLAALVRPAIADSSSQMVQPSPGSQVHVSEQDPSQEGIIRAWNPDDSTASQQQCVLDGIFGQQNGYWLLYGCYIDFTTPGGPRYYLMVYGCVQCFLVLPSEQYE